MSGRQLDRPRTAQEQHALALLRDELDSAIAAARACPTPDAARRLIAAQDALDAERMRQECS